MGSKCLGIFSICLLVVSVVAIKSIEGAVMSNQSLQIQLEAAESNFTQGSEVFVLVPTGTNLSDLQVNGGVNFNLFKLDTDLFFNNKKLETTVEDSNPNEQEDVPDVKKAMVSELHGGRESPTSSSSNANPVVQTARPATAGIQSSGGSSVQFANQQLRPSAVMDDSSPDFNVETSSLNSTVNQGMVVRGQQQQIQPVQQMNTLPIVQGARRPMNPFVMNRRPLNLMPFRRPVRQVQVIRNRTNEKAEVRASGEEGTLTPSLKSPSKI